MSCHVQSYPDYCRLSYDVAPEEFNLAFADWSDAHGRVRTPLPRFPRPVKPLLLSAPPSYRFARHALSRSCHCSPLHRGGNAVSTRSE